MTCETTHTSDCPHLAFVLGCTASGKGAVGRELARRIGGRVVSVDSMKVYRRMDIGTAKPAVEVRSEIPHYCIDVVEPWESYSAARFVEDADAGIAETRAAGATPLAVGGASLYIKALAEGLFEGPSARPGLRAQLKARAAGGALPAMHAELAEVDPDAARRIHPNDQRRVIRALEVYRTTGAPISELQKQWEAQRRYDCLFIGLRREKRDNNRRINARVKRMVNAGLVEEVRSLWESPRGLSAQAAQAVGYAELIEHFEGRATLEEAIERVKINTRRLSKKQRTWQRRWRDVHWFDVAAAETPERLAERILSECDLEGNAA